MEYKVLALDLDGTVFNSKKEIDKETIQAIHEYKDRGGTVVICSGRSPLSTKWVSETLGLDDPIVAYNGAVFQEANGQILAQAAFSQQGILTFLEACERYDVYGHLYEGDHLLVPERNRWNNNWIENNIPALHFSGGKKETCEYFRRQCSVKQIDDLQDYVSANTPQILKFAAFRKDEKQFHEFRQYLNGLNNEFVVSSSLDFLNLEISPVNTTKGTALSELIQSLSFEWSEVAAIGDNFNDVDMLQSAGLGIAMGNAPEEVKAKANTVTTANDELGVAKAIKERMLS
ncbi:HAD family hydrolase [Mesobacillus maritimus]|uniref:HAD family hydrolase n=1 Tax=Mesobacillus maritimus TaxID=1643336 RepID=UPI00203FE21C|nr:HAD family hydrolase [Mesobacillus maritimus]MCM3587537.1 HAD family hydrolase [Mesobacillus maritimus]